MKEQDRRLTGEHPEFLKRKAKLKKLHKKLIEREISIIKPLRVLNGIKKEFLKGKGKVLKQSFDYVENFNLRWTEWSIVEQSGYRVPHELSITFYHFMFESNQVIKSVDLACPGFVVIGGTEAKSIKAGFKNISSFNPDVSTVFKIPDLLGEIKTNFKEIKPLFEQALKKAYYNSALEK